MGDGFQAIVDVDASDAEAKSLAARALDWLWAQGIVERALSDCVPGSGGGYGPGERYAEWVDPEDEIPEDKRSDLRQLRTNGLDLSAVRNVSVSVGWDEVGKCPRGHTRQLPDDWGDVIGLWYDGSDDAGFTCEVCGADYPVREWRLEPWLAAGSLSLTFWNWPSLGDRFTAEIAKLVEPHRIVRIAGKL